MKWILHHYDFSNFSEKVRLMLGLKGIAWDSVEIPSHLPKPDYLPLTGGYRRTPSLQIGADVYCDTHLIAEVIEAHYGGQAARLGPEEAELKGTIEEFQADEREHRATALDHGAEQTPGYQVLRGAIKSGSRLAIWLSERI